MSGPAPGPGPGPGPVPRRTGRRPGAADTREDLGERIAAFILGLWDGPAVRPLLAGLLRAATTDPVAAAMLRRMLAEGPFLSLATAIDRPDAELRAVLVATQLIGLATARYVVGVEPIASAPADDLARAVGPTIQRYLTGEIDGGPRAAELRRTDLRRTS